MLGYSLALIDSIKSWGVRYWASWSQVGPEELGKWSLVLETPSPLDSEAVFLASYILFPLGD